MGRIDLVSSNEVGVFNANPCPNPDPKLKCYGLPAPIPSWVLPQYRRDSTMTDPTNRATGVNEYSYVAGAGWSQSENLFYVPQVYGGPIFKLTTTGDSTVTTLTHKISEYGGHLGPKRAVFLAFVFGQLVQVA